MHGRVRWPHSVSFSVPPAITLCKVPISTECTNSTALYNTTTQMVALTATQRVHESSSHPRAGEQNETACNRCWRLKKKVCQLGCSSALEPTSHGVHQRMEAYTNTVPKPQFLHRCASESAKPKTQYSLPIAPVMLFHSGIWSRSNLH